MGDLLRKFLQKLLELMVKAAMPSLMIYAVLLVSLVVRGTPDEPFLLLPGQYLRILLTAYLIGLLCTLVLYFNDLRTAVVRTDEALIGRAFSGLRKRDRLFCDSLTLLCRERPREALDGFLTLQECELNEQESGVLDFYTGRCYQLLDCPSTAVNYYVTAREHGFSEPVARLFEARSLAEGGAFDESFKVYQDLLASDPPKEFHFLYTDIGTLFIRQNRPAEAEEWFGKSIEQRQNYAFALSGMAIAALQRGNFPEARQYRYRALVNQLQDPGAFREYFEETKAIVLEDHPEWRERAEIFPPVSASQPAAPSVQAPEQTNDQ